MLGGNLKEFYRTCESHPSQWEGVLDNGCMIYVRFRWGKFSINQSKTPVAKVEDFLSNQEKPNLILNIGDGGEMPDIVALWLLQQYGFDFSLVINN